MPWAPPRSPSPPVPAPTGKRRGRSGWLLQADAVRLPLGDGCLDAVFADRGGRPHWGKLFDVAPASLATRYPRFGDFAALAADMDPGGKFRNRMLTGLLGEG